MMAVETAYPHIVKRPGEPVRLESHPRTRVSQIVLDYTEYGWSPDEIQRQHPYLTDAGGGPLHTRLLLRSRRGD